MRNGGKRGKHWHTNEFVQFVDEIIAKAHEPTSYSTYNLGAPPKA